jgi:hypothetical protein
LLHKTAKILFNREEMTENREYKPILFITLTWKHPKQRDCIEIECRKYISRLARLYKGHIKKTIGIEAGDNSHAHIVVYSNDIEPGAVDLERIGQVRMFPFGRVDAQHYNIEAFGLKGHFYALLHQGINDAGEVFCGSNRRRSCKKGRCKEREKVRQANKRFNDFKTSTGIRSRRSGLV